MDEFHIKIAEAVKLHRKKARLSQKSLADYAGIGKTAVYDIEHGKPSIQVNTLLKVLNVLNIRLQIQTRLTLNEVNDETS